jgi:hypothetical protein
MGPRCGQCRRRLPFPHYSALRSLRQFTSALASSCTTSISTSQRASDHLSGGRGRYLFLPAPALALPRAPITLVAWLGTLPLTILLAASLYYLLDAPSF